MEEQNTNIDPMPNDNRRKDLGDHAVKAGENVAKVSGKVATGVLRELWMFISGLTFKAKVIFIIISILLVLIAYFFGYRAGEANAKSDAIEKLNQIESTLN